MFYIFAYIALALISSQSAQTITNLLSNLKKRICALIYLNHLSTDSIFLGNKILYMINNSVKKNMSKRSMNHVVKYEFFTD